MGAFLLPIVFGIWNANEDTPKTHTEGAIQGERRKVIPKYTLNLKMASG